MAQIIGLFSHSRQKKQRQDWSNQDLAELYRVESALVQAGLSIDTERGRTDEGDPWFVFCQGASGDVIVHFARIDDEYVIAAPALPYPLRGSDLATIVRQFVADNPVSLPTPEPQRPANVRFHPAALLTIFVATLLISNMPSESLATGLTEEDQEDEPEIVWGAPSAGMGPSETLEDDRASRGEQAFLVADVAMAIEIVRLEIASWPNGFGDEGLPPQVTSLNGQLSAQVQSDVTPDVDLYGLSSAFHEGLQNESRAVEARTVVETGRVEAKKAAFVPKGEFVTDAIVFPEPQIEEPAVLMSHDSLIVQATFTRQEDSSDPALLQVVLKTQAEEVVGRSASSTSEGLQNAARNRVEDVVRTEGQNLVTLDRSVRDEAEEAPQVIEIVKEPVAEPMPDAAAVEAEMAAAFFERMAAFNEDVFRIVTNFQASDDDITLIMRSNGSAIIYDRSDVRAVEDTLSHTWVFDDETTLTIIGHMDVIAEALVA